VRLWDTVAREKFAQAVPGQAFFETPLECAEGADAALILTDWPAVREIDLAALRKVMRCPIVIDGRNVFAPAVMLQHGFIYHSMGRRPVIPPQTR
jgi:UDPglucose 6-dehydrogenase